MFASFAIQSNRKYARSWFSTELKRLSVAKNCLIPFEAFRSSDPSRIFKSYTIRWLWAITYGLGIFLNLTVFILHFTE